jgi:RNA polymerase sigma-70 factor (ECF subfamily)
MSDDRRPLREAGPNATTEASTVALPRPKAPTPSPLNVLPSDASKRDQRAAEAEEDRVFIAQAQHGDTSAFRRLVERHQRRAHAHAYSLLRDDNDAREVVQEAFLRVHKNLATFEGSSAFYTWLYRIVTNLSIDRMRRPGRKTAEFADDRNHEDANAEFPLISRIDGADPIDVIRRKEIARRVQAALEALPPYHRGVILLREVEGLSYEEMAQAMNVSKGTIMSRLFHARQKLQRALADVYAELDGARPRGATEGEEES